MRRPTGEPDAAGMTPPRASRPPASPLASLTLVALVPALVLASARIAVDPRVFQGDRAGLVGPGAAALGVSPQSLTLAAWLVALVLVELVFLQHGRVSMPDGPSLRIPLFAIALGTTVAVAAIATESAVAIGPGSTATARPASTGTTGSRRSSGSAVTAVL